MDFKSGDDVVMGLDAELDIAPADESSAKEANAPVSAGKPGKERAVTMTEADRGSDDLVAVMAAGAMGDGQVVCAEAGGVEGEGPQVRSLDELGGRAWFRGAVPGIHGLDAELCAVLLREQGQVRDHPGDIGRIGAAQHLHQRARAHHQVRAPARGRTSDAAASRPRSGRRQSGSRHRPG